MKVLRIFTAVCAALAILGISSCKSSKKSVSTGGYTPETAVEDIISDATEDFKALAQSYKAWNNVTVPVRLNMSQPKNFSISGTMKMKNGESILISARMFGFEVASIYADNDSIIVYVKAMDMYLSEPVSALSSRYGITLADLQSLLLGQAFIPGKGAVTAGDAGKLDIGKKKNTTFSFSPRKMPKGLAWAYSAESDGTNVVLTAIAIEPTSGSPIDCMFGDMAQSPAGTVAGAVDIATQIKNRPVSMTLLASPDKARWNENPDIAKPKISKKARRVGPEDIMKMLKTL